MPEATADAHAAWRRDRLAYVSSPTGNLALVAFQPVDATPTPVEHLPGVRTWRVGDEQGVWIRAAADQGVSVNGVPVDGETFVDRLRADGTPLITCGQYAVDAFSLDGSDFELRVYDAESSARSDFAGIDVYDFDPDWVLQGRLSAYTDNRLVPWEFTRESDTGHTKNVPGILSVVIGEEAYDLTAFVDTGNLVLVFSDGTTGAESYQPGRFLRMSLPGPDGLVEMDFNTAFIPPCGFSYFYSCPIPPQENRIAAPIRAGEREVRWHGTGH